MVTQRRQTSSKHSPAGTEFVATPVGSAYGTETGKAYRLHRLLGNRGFCEVCLATPRRRDGFPAQVCVKISDRLSAWLREAYFAEMLGREPRALRVFDRFAQREGPRMRYCLA